MTTLLQAKSPPTTRASSIPSIDQQLADACDQIDNLDVSHSHDSDADFEDFVEIAQTVDKVPEETEEGKVTLKPGDALEVAPKKTRFVSPRDFQLLKVIGMGAFGKVLQVRNKYSGQVLAMKVISKRRLRRKEGYIENVMAEKQILMKVRHPFVVTMHCSFQTKEKLFIIMDFLAGSELFLRLGKEGIFLEKDAAFYLAEIILALDHLHGLGIIHRDLKPENILLGSDGHICITDFGLAKHFENGLNEEDERALTICGTNEYISPEMLSRQGYGKASDYWSLGCIAYEMLASQPPFVRQKNESTKQLFSRIMSEKVKMPPGSSAEACKLLKGLLTRNVQNRLGNQRSTMFEVGGVSALKRQPFFEHIQWDKLEKKEVDPPQQFDIDHAEDVQHFHEEFVSMELPRSVVYMSREDWRPRNVDSSTFRSFSFIHDDFALPERNEDEVKKYWEVAEDDGESESDVASSKAGDVENLPEPVTETKKRPPRKRKKKNKQAASTESTPAVSAATTPAVSASTTPAPSTTASPVVSRATSPVNMGQNIELETIPEPLVEKKVEVEKPTLTAAVKIQAAKPQAPVPPPPPSRPVEPTWQSVGSVKNTNHIQQVASPKARTPQYNVNGSNTNWTTVRSSPNAPSLPAQARWGGPPSIPTKDDPKTALKPEAREFAPPGWQQQQRVTSTSSNSSSDWRQHSMSPRSNKSAKDFWPTLGTAPASREASPRNTTLKGAWARK